MFRMLPLFRISCLILLCAGLSGCDPSSGGPVDEQKDPHSLNGRSKVAGLDYLGAIEEFEKALETNPRSALAHLELALLYEEQMKDYAAAIHHYERHLKLRPGSEYADRARERIKSCKMDLVKSEVLGPVNQGMQRELERLTTENMLLQQRVQSLEAQMAGRLPVLHAAPAPAPVSPQAAVYQQAPAPPVSPQPAPVSHTPRPEPVQQTRKPRVHVIREGDKLTVLAKEYGVELGKLMRANPGVDPSRLKIGQKINIP